MTNNTPSMTAEQITKEGMLKEELRLREKAKKCLEKAESIQKSIGIMFPESTNNPLLSGDYV